MAGQYESSSLAVYVAETSRSGPYVLQAVCRYYSLPACPNSANTDFARIMQVGQVGRWLVSSGPKYLKKGKALCAVPNTLALNLAL